MDETQTTRAAAPRGWSRAAFVVLSALALALLGGWAYSSWRYDAELTQAEREIAEGRHAEARDRLARLAVRWPGLDEVEHPLGLCEAALGNVGAALDAWGRVPSGSVYFPRAALDRARLALERGRLSVAEASLEPILGRSDEVGAEANRLAMRLDLYSGRRRRIARRIERLWRTAPDQVELLRARWLLDTQPFPLESVREALETASREAPEDDRVWLGRADLAVRVGRLDEANELLGRCEAARPGDPDVAEVRLAWALAAGRLSAAWEALRQIPAGTREPADVADLRARLAALGGDAGEEEAALRQLVELAPGESESWARLADLAARRGLDDLRVECRRREAEVDKVRDEYRMRIGAVRPDDLSGVPRLAQLAESLGRRFEARGWWSLQSRRDPGDPDARTALARLGRPDRAAPRGKTLADLLPATGPPPDPAGVADGGPVVPRFTDDAESAGLRFVYENDQTPLRRLPETMGGGIGLIDYDGDGLLDVYAVQGGTFPDGASDPEGGDRLFRNRGDGTFEDVSARAGISAFPRGFGHGVAVGDYDGDGRPDLFVTRWRQYALYRNRGDGTFEDATEQAGLGGERGWPTSAAFADLDDDGDLDLYVCQYLRWDPERSEPCPDPERPGGHQYCVPRAFEAEPDRVFRNDGGRFVDVSEEAGITRGDPDGRGLGVVAADLDDDGRVDLFVADDMTANLLFLNRGGFRFEEVGEASGAGSNAEGGYQAGMGIACGDLDGDRRFDLAVTNFYGECTTFFQNLGSGLFADRSRTVGLAAPTRYVLGFGAAFLDANNDGRLDLAQANGHVNDFRPSTPYAMPAQLLLGAAGGRLVDVGEAAGDCWRLPRVGRGLAVGDLDNDGDLDLVVLAQGGPLAFFRNGGVAGPDHSGGHFLTLQLQGTNANRDGVGARVQVESGGTIRVGQRISGGSFLSASDPRLHFGLGPGQEPPRVDVEVRWPGGRVDRHVGLVGDAGYRLVEGDPEPKPLAGFGPGGASGR